jgi:hypothetical protein
MIVHTRARPGASPSGVGAGATVVALPAGAGGFTESETGRFVVAGCLDFRAKQDLPGEFSVRR